VGLSFDWTINVGSLVVFASGVFGAAWWLWGVQGTAKAARRDVHDFREEVATSLKSIEEKLDSFPTRRETEQAAEDMQRQIDRIQAETVAQKEDRQRLANEVMKLVGKFELWAQLQEVRRAGGTQ
jgi:hypothetical protein